MEVQNAYKEKQGMMYSLYGRMSLDSASRQGEWYCLKSKIPLDKVDELTEHYCKTWRYVEKREEKNFEITAY